MSYAFADSYSWQSSHSSSTASTTGNFISKFFGVKKDDTFGVNAIPTYDVTQKIRSLKEWGTNWDGAGALAVTPATIERATALVSNMYVISQSISVDWIAPNVTANPHGEIVLEWWKMEKKLTIYISEDACDYVQVWGPDIDDDMDDGVLTDDKFSELMVWMRD